MYLIAEQPYIKVLREVTSIEQRDIEYERVMCFYKEKITTQHREFPIDEVLDISYRHINGEGGLLYLHTTGGVFSYTVKTSPKSFVETVKDYIK
ncbi:hypothetical protein QGM71_10480 [Virgibacillus sp. C22-A2]|uniref:Uncharacterized protein n=1 Tax=Virgibacillus tibetensis TaxID=3042313 RepID=A0ABU6KG97_9BACI|nr:hypothetical protein [Virgibacillus sp. C22-A2]